MARTEPDQTRNNLDIPDDIPPDEAEAGAADAVKAGAGGALASGVTGASISGGIASTIGAAVGGELAARDLVDDAQPERPIDADIADSPDNFSGGGATSGGQDDRGPRTED
jgi:hypothetical protein